MGGKKKGKKGRKGKGKDAEEPPNKFQGMLGEVLEITLKSLKDKLEDAKIKRNWLQIEKDMMHDFYHNTRSEISEIEAKITNFDTKVQESEAAHRTDKISLKQKIAHLEFEHRQNQDQVKTYALEQMGGERVYHQDIEKTNLK